MITTTVKPFRIYLDILCVQCVCRIMSTASLSLYSSGLLFSYEIPGFPRPFKALEQTGSTLDLH